MSYHNEITSQGTTTVTTPFPWEKPRDFGADWSTTPPPCDCITGILYLPDRGRYSSDDTIEGISDENWDRFPRLLQAPQDPGWDTVIDVPEGWAISIEDPRESPNYNPECWVVYKKAWRTHAPAGSLATDGTPIGTPGVALTPEELEELKLPLPGEPGGPPENYIRTETRIFCKGKDPREGESGEHDFSIPEDPQGHWPCLPIDISLPDFDMVDAAGNILPWPDQSPAHRADEREQAEGFRDRLKSFGLYPLEEMSDEELDAIGRLKRGEVSPGGVRRPESVDPGGLNQDIPTWSDMNNQVKEDRKLWDEMSESQKEGWRDWLKQEWDRERELKEAWSGFPRESEHRFEEGEENVIDIKLPGKEIQDKLQKHGEKWRNSKGFVPSEDSWSPPGWGWDPEKGWIQGNPEHDIIGGRDANIEPFIDSYSGPLGGPQRNALEGIGPGIIPRRINRIYFKITDPTWVANNPDIPPILDVSGLNIGDRGQGWEVVAIMPGTSVAIDPEDGLKSPWQLPGAGLPDGASLQELNQIIDSPDLLNAVDLDALIIARSGFFDNVGLAWHETMAPTFVFAGAPSRLDFLGGNVSPPFRDRARYGPDAFRREGRKYLDSLKYPKPPKFDPPTTKAEIRDPDYFKKIVPFCTGTSVWPWLWTNLGWKEAVPGGIPELPWWPVNPPERGKPQPTITDMINRWNQTVLPPPIGPSGAPAFWRPRGSNVPVPGEKVPIPIPKPVEGWKWQGDNDPFKGAPPWYKWDGLFYKQWIPIGWPCPTRPSTPADLAPGGLLGPPKDPKPEEKDEKRWITPPGLQGVKPGEIVADVGEAFEGVGLETTVTTTPIPIYMTGSSTTTTTTPTPEDASGYPEIPGLDAPPGWEWDAPSIAEPWPHAVDDLGRPAEPTQGGWKMPYPGDKSGLLPKIFVPHPGRRWKWIPAKQVSPPNKKGESYWRPGYWEDRGYGNQRPWKRGEDPSSIPNPELHLNPGSRFRVNPDNIPGLAPDVAFPRRWPNPFIDKWKGHHGPRLPDERGDGLADWQGFDPGGHGPRIPPLIKLGPGDKIDLSLGTPLNKQERAELAAELFNRNIPLPPDLEEFREALENARAGGRENIGEG